MQYFCGFDKYILKQNPNHNRGLNQRASSISCILILHIPLQNFLPYRTLVQPKRNVKEEEKSSETCGAIREREKKLRIDIILCLLQLQAFAHSAHGSISLPAQLFA